MAQRRPTSKPACSKTPTKSKVIQENSGSKTILPVPTQPLKNSILKLNDRINSVRSDLLKATDEGGVAEDVALSLARDRVLNSPRTNLEFRKTVARKVDFKPEEKVFSHLASLTIEESPTVVGRRTREKPAGKHDPEPRLEDFHRPYEGEEHISISDTASIKNLVSQIDKSQKKRRPRETLPNIFF